MPLLLDPITLLCPYSANTSIFSPFTWLMLPPLPSPSFPGQILSAPRLTPSKIPTWAHRIPHNLGLCSSSETEHSGKWTFLGRRGQPKFTVPHLPWALSHLYGSLESSHLCAQVTTLSFQLCHKGSCSAFSVSDLTATSRSSGSLSLKSPFLL